MKKTFMKIFLTTLSVFLLTGCHYFISQDESEPSEPVEVVDETPIDETPEVDPDTISQELESWLPRYENVVYSYEGSGNEFASFAWNPQFNQENYYQIVTNNGGTVVAEIFEYSENEITRTFTRAETYFRDNFSEIDRIDSETESEIYLKTPIDIGTTWESLDGVYEITSINETITVPAGTYEAIEVSISYPNSTTRRYYAQDVGLIYEVHDTGEFVVESKLSSTLTDTPESLLLSIYVPDEQAMGMDVVSAELILNTNEPARIALQNLLSGNNEQYPMINILPEGTQIQYLFLNNENIVEVDLSEEFINMNAGSTGELFYLYTLVNTLSSYYGTNEVLLTVNGEEYEGPHVVLQEGETLRFNEEMVN